MKRLTLLVFSLFTFHCISQTSQYFLVGNSYGIPPVNTSACGISDTCFTLTDELNYQLGAVWDLTPIDLNISFDATFCLTLGDNDDGADGFAFVIRGLNSDSIGNSGGGLGYEGILPSLAIEFDTYFNEIGYLDIPLDHTAMIVNSDQFNPLVSNTPLHPLGLNMEDHSYHSTRITWNASTHFLNMYFDDVLRMSKEVDLINSIFSGQNLTYWGFTASTGGKMNLQQICFPERGLQLQNDTVCYPHNASFSYYSENMSSYTWTNSFNDTLFHWNFIDDGPFNLDDSIIEISTNGMYTLDVGFNNSHLIDSAQAIIVQLPIEPFSFDEVQYCPNIGEVIELNAQNPGMIYNWNPDTLGTNQSITVSNYVGQIEIVIFDSLLVCSISDSIDILSMCDIHLEMPNIFTPNGDGINDFFEPIYLLGKEFTSIISFEIYNRWGNLMYSSSEAKWNGYSNSNKLAADGVYYYNIKYKDNKDEFFEKQGFLELFKDLK